MTTDVTHNIYIDIEMLAPPSGRRMLAQPQPVTERTLDTSVQLQIARVEAGATQAELSRSSKVALGKITRFEAGKEPVDGVTLKVLQAALKRLELEEEQEP